MYVQNSEAGMFYNDSVEKFLYCAIVLPIVYGFSVCNIQKRIWPQLGKHVQLIYLKLLFC